jgi:hypothetical protein
MHGVPSDAPPSSPFTHISSLINFSTGNSSTSCSRIFIVMVLLSLSAMVVATTFSLYFSATSPSTASKSATDALVPTTSDWHTKSVTHAIRILLSRAT